MKVRKQMDLHELREVLWVLDEVARIERGVLASTPAEHAEVVTRLAHMRQTAAQLAKMVTAAEARSRSPEWAEAANEATRLMLRLSQLRRRYEQEAPSHSEAWREDVKRHLDRLAQHVVQFAQSALD